MSEELDKLRELGVDPKDIIIEIDNGYGIKIRTNLEWFVDWTSPESIESLADDWMEAFLEYGEANKL